MTKEEKSGSREIIDSVTSSPFNGWIQRKISFIAQARGYNVSYFPHSKYNDLIVFSDFIYSRFTSKHKRYLDFSHLL